MSEKTAEEKLREELEGRISGSSKKESATHAGSLGVPESKPLRVRARRKPERPESVGQRVDSFMEDFEKRVAESLNAGKAQKTQARPSKPRLPKKDNSVKTSVVEAEKNSGKDNENVSVLSRLEKSLEEVAHEVPKTEILPAEEIVSHEVSQEASQPDVLPHD